MIDAHQHCWQIGRHDCTWPTPDLEAIHRDFGPEDWRAVAGPLGIEQSVLVQSQASDRDTDYLVELAGQWDCIAALVAWVDLASPRAPQRIARLAGQPKVRGLRPMLQNLAEDDWILKPQLAPAIEAMQAAGLSFDALVTPRHLPYLQEFVQRYPRLPIVIDHAAKPGIAQGRLSPWREQMAALAARPQVFCKLSGLLTEAAPGQGQAQLQPYVDELWRQFGANRLLWGSDWPVVNLAADYRRWFTMARNLLSKASAADLAQVFDGNARAFYRVAALSSSAEG